MRKALLLGTVVTAIGCQQILGIEAGRRSDAGAGAGDAGSSAEGGSGATGEGTGAAGGGGMATGGTGGAGAGGGAGGAGGSPDTNCTPWLAATHASPWIGTPGLPSDLTSDDTFVYWAEESGRVAKADKSSFTPTEIEVGMVAGEQLLAITAPSPANNMIYLGVNDESFWRMSTMGMATMGVGISVPFSAAGAASAGGYAFLGDGDSDGRIVRLNMTDHILDYIDTNDRTVVDIDADSVNVYAAVSTVPMGILRSAVAGMASATMVCSSDPAPSRVSVNRMGTVFWLAGDKLLSCPTTNTDGVQTDLAMIPGAVDLVAAPNDRTVFVLDELGAIHCFDPFESTVMPVSIAGTTLEMPHRIIADGAAIYALYRDGATGFVRRILR